MHWSRGYDTLRILPWNQAYHGLRPGQKVSMALLRLKSCLVALSVLICAFKPSGCQQGGVIHGTTFFNWHKLDSTRHGHWQRRSLLQNARFDKPYKICTSAWAPIVTCTAGDDPSTYSGYQIEVFREIANAIGWQSDDWFFDCIDWTEMMDDLAASNGTCFMAASGEWKPPQHEEGHPAPAAMQHPALALMPRPRYSFVYTLDAASIFRARVLLVMHDKDHLHHTSCPCALPLHGFVWDPPEDACN